MNYKKTSTSFISFVKQFMFEFSKIDIIALSAQSSFYFILSIFPFLILSLIMLPFFNLDLITIFETYFIFLPTEVYNLAIFLMNNLYASTTSYAISITALILFWSSSSFLNSLVFSINKIHGIEKKKGFLFIFAIRLLLSSIFLFVFLIFIIIFPIANFILELADFPTINKFFSFFYSYLFPLIMFIFIFLLYYIVPLKRISKLGAFLSTIWFWVIALLFFRGFGFYLTNIAQYNAFYGSIGGVIIFLLWTQMICIIFFSGALITKCLSHHQV